MPMKRLALTLIVLAAVPPAMPASPDYVALTNATLVLGGGGKLPDGVRERFVELAGGKKAKLVVLSAAVAADADALLGPWRDLGAATVELRHTRDKARAGEAEFHTALADATGVWLDGDDPAVFQATYAGTPVEKELRKLLDRGGVIGAQSAIAALAGKTWIETIARGAKLSKGFGWLPAALVDVHFLRRNRIDRMQQALAKQPGLLGIGIDEGTAAVIRLRSLRVLGDSYATLCLAPSPRRGASVQTLAKGGEADLVALQKAALDRSQSPFPADKPAAPEVAKGTLIIGGGGGMPVEGWTRFIELAGGPDALIVVVPTAMDDPTVEPGEAKALKRFGAKNVKILHTKSRKEADTEAFAAPLRKAGGVWFSGGRQWRFVDAYEGTLTEKLFHEVLARGGVIAGSSAGASIQSEYMPRGHPLGNLVMMAEGYERGFGFLPGVAVDQHFFARKRLADMSDLIRVYPQLLGIGIDEGTIIVVKGSVFEVVGKSKVAVYDRKKPIGADGKDYEELTPSMRYDMKTRKRVEKE
jgi:cyanophycinase